MTQSNRARKLSKADAERLMGSIDTDTFLDTLGLCLAIVMGVESAPVPELDPVAAMGDSGPALRWAALIERAASLGQWSEERRSDVMALNVNSLCDLATELNERRSLA